MDARHRETKNSAKRQNTVQKGRQLRNGHSFESVLNSTVIMGKGTPAKRGKKRSKKQQESIFADTDEDSDVPVRSPTAYEGERADRIAQNARVLGALVSRPLPMADEIRAAKPTRKRCEPKRLHARSMPSTLLCRCRKAAAAGPSQPQQSRALRTRVQAPLAGQGLLTDPADSQEVRAEASACAFDHTSMPSTLLRPARHMPAGSWLAESENGVVPGNP